MGAVFLVLGATGWLDRLGAVFPREVIRGVQLAVGLLFAKIAWGMVSAPPCHLHRAVAPGAHRGGLHRHHGRPAAVAAGQRPDRGGPRAGPGGRDHVGHRADGPRPDPDRRCPRSRTADLLLAATLLVLPQVPLTITNSCLAPADAAPVYFPAEAPRITPSRLALTLGGANLAVGAISGMPLCHGAGGHERPSRVRCPQLARAGHHRGALVVLALALGQDLALVLQAFPLAILAALLLVAGITHVRLLADLRGRFAWAVAWWSASPGPRATCWPRVIIGTGRRGAGAPARPPDRGLNAGTAPPPCVAGRYPARYASRRPTRPPVRSAAPR